MQDTERDEIEADARHLYGLIHARYIITSHGLSKMVIYYKKIIQKIKIKLKKKTKKLHI